MDFWWGSKGRLGTIHDALEGLKLASILVLFGRMSCDSFGTSARRPLNVLFGRPQVQYGRSIDVHWTSAGPLGYIRLTHTSSENVFKMSSRRIDQDQYIRLVIRLQEIAEMSSKRLQDVFKTSFKNVLKTSSRRFEDVFKMSSRCLQDVFKSSSRRLQDALQKCLQDIFRTSCKDVFKALSRLIIKLDCSYTFSRCLGDVFKTFLRRTPKTVSIEGFT